MTRRVRIAAQVAPQHATWQQITDAVRRAEDLGVDIVFNWDHFFPLTGDPDGAHFEAWTMLAALAESTERVELGTLVNCTIFRNADLQADMARTIDHISGGRFIFGTGAGWFEREFDEYGYPFGTPGQRLDTLENDLHRIRARWAKLNPSPVRQIPVLIGGKGEQKTLRIVAEHADIWHSFVEPDAYQQKAAVLARWCETVGRDVSDIEFASGTGPRGQGSLEFDYLDRQHEIGVTLFSTHVMGPEFDDSGVRRLLEWRASRGLS